jgi:Flp pilus assembly CpaE family ATPase
VALSLATEWAAQHRCVLLVDADVYGGAVGQALGLLDEAPGLAAAVRQANGGTLTRQVLRSTALQVKSGLAVLTGISRPQRWIELRPAAVEAVLATARAMFDVVVVDCGFSLERDEELSYDTAAPRRNGVTFAVLELANIVVAVGSADPIGMQRLLRALGDLREACPQVEPVVVLNKVRRSPGAGEADLRRLLLGECGSLPAACVPFEPDVFASAALAGRSLAESAPRSAARQVLRDLAGTLLGEATSDAVTGRPGWRLARQYRRRVAAGRTDQPAGAGS